MEYVYAAMLLHSAGKEIEEKAVSAVLAGAGVDVDDARVKALVASLGGVDIAEAMTQAVAAPAAAAAPPQPLLVAIQRLLLMNQKKRKKKKADSKVLALCLVKPIAPLRFSGCLGMATEHSLDPVVLPLSSR